jgi:tyrosyl-tRNA synthetase
MSLSADLQKRGFIKDKTFEDLAFLDKPQAFYFGVDPSADSLTIGNLAPLMLARRLSDSGWKAILLVGGATSLIGDPGGKNEERSLLSREEVVKNVAAVEKQIAKLFAGEKFTPVDNYDWFKNIGYLEFLRDVGKHFSMTELVQREFIAERMGEQGSGISYAEFSYNLIQGYDFWHLYKNHKAVMQIGGSDQWGNMLSGVALIRKKESQEAHALSMPLIVNKATGKKFGKSEGGAVWLDPVKTSPTQFYQFWINVDDADVADYLKIFTLLPLEKIQEIMDYHVSSPEERKAQIALAREVTELVHGKEQTHTAGVVTDVLTGRTSVGEVSEGILAEVRKEIKAETFKNPPTVLEALVATGLATSNSEARRLISGGAVYVNGKAFSGQEFTDEQFVNGRLLLRRGKAFKDSALIELRNA